MHAVITSSSLPLWLGAVLSDWAYARTDQVQWTNFAAWLVAGGMVVAGIALVWALVAAAVGRLRGARPWPYLATLVTTLVLAFVNALVHARDAWAAMPTGLVLSAAVLVVAIFASALGLAAARRGGASA